MKTNNTTKRNLPMLFMLTVLIISCFFSMQISAKYFYNIEAMSYGKDRDNDGVKDKKDKCPDTPKGVAVSKEGCPLDGDKDGVSDYMDKCPRLMGNSAMNGCPDTDKDGVADNEDECANVPGHLRFKGCPDSDNDGIEDSKDKCPNAKGLDAFKGCPDTDGDGVEDAMDKCPDTQKGVKMDANGCPADTDGDGIPDFKDKCPNSRAEGSANGCPEIKVLVIKRLQTIASAINFETGKASLKPSSFPKLDELVSLMNEYPDYTLKMGGHTDNVGDDNANFTLSQARMDAVKSYLASKGLPLSRIEAVGYGETKPIAPNTTAEGKMQNRRVELEMVVK